MTNDTNEDDPKSVRMTPSDDPALRAEKCRAAIRNVLEFNRCRILPSLAVEPVGASQVARQALVTADWIVVPEA